MSLLRYPGGKSRACKILNEIIKKYDFDVTQVISPFFGSGSFEFFLQKTYDSHIKANDIFSPLMIFWVCLKINPSRLVEEIKAYRPVTKEGFYTLRSTLNDERKKISHLPQGLNKEDRYSFNPFSLGAIFFVLNRCSFNGSTCSGGYSREATETRFTTSSIQRLEKARLDNIKFYNYSFEDFLSAQDDETFIFLDPPYFLEKSRLYGSQGDLHENFPHQKLHSILLTKKNWILCYNDCPYIRRLYQDYEITSLSWAYGMNKSKKSSEIVIVSKR